MPTLTANIFALDILLIASCKYVINNKFDLFYPTAATFVSINVVECL